MGLVNNRSLRSRCAGVGIFSPQKVKAYGVQGVIARASGVVVDSRLGLGYAPYACYPALALTTFIGVKGDAYERFIVRAREMLESFALIAQLLAPLAQSVKPTYNSTSRAKFVSMEGVITHFKGTTSAVPVAALGQSVGVVEGPKGLVGVSVVAAGLASPYRFQVRSPVAHNLHLLSTCANGYTFADFVTTFCSLDVVLGEIDR